MNTNSHHNSMVMTGGSRANRSHGVGCRLWSRQDCCRPWPGGLAANGATHRHERPH